MSEMLTIRDLRVTHHDGTVALRGVSLTVGARERVGLIGPNGAGKTSLLLAVMGALPFEGQVVADGLTLGKATLDEVRGRCGMIFQDASDQLFMPTLLEDAAFGPLNQGHAPDAARDKALSALSAVGLAGLEDRSPHHLSGGQMRCAALATVLAMDARLLLLDEPGANLDARSRRRLIELLEGRPEAMLLATHDLDMVRRLCPRTVVLDGGLVAADGPTGQVLGDGRLMEAHGLA
jgi:energy-coupling factor transporter ATP-binding protein EcfA2